MSQIVWAKKREDIPYSLNIELTWIVQTVRIEVWTQKSARVQVEKMTDNKRHDIPYWLNFEWPWDTHKMIREKLSYLQLAQAFSCLLKPPNFYYTFGAYLPFAHDIRVFLLVWSCLLQVSQVTDLLSLFFLLPPDELLVAQFLNYFLLFEPKIRMVLSYFWLCVFLDHFLIPG